LVYTLVSLASAYGDQQGNTAEIFNIPEADLAAIADIKLAEVPKILNKLTELNWLNIDPPNNVIRLLDLKSLKHLSHLG
ncbi:MAG: Crp/Fnr family transcriptional regulator, partial [Phormidesmis sp.]